MLLKVIFSHKKLQYGVRAMQNLRTVVLFYINIFFLCLRFLICSSLGLSAML